MANQFLEKQLESIVKSTFGPQAVTVVKEIAKIAERQGGNSIIENYQLLSKRALIGVGAAIAVVNVGGMVVSRYAQKRQIEKAVAKALAEERAREAGDADGGNGARSVGIARFFGKTPKARKRRAASKAPKLGADADAEAETARDIADSSQGLYRRFGKRACDVVVSVAALPVVGAVTAVSGIAIKREDGGPVFYNAPRVGLGGREFTMFKLRSMQVDAPDLVMDDGSTYNGPDDPRMTRVGAFLRKTSLDEIPQFLNVLRGDMSVVGPRPDLKRETELYQGDEALKLTVKPGVTGYAAVYGRNSLPWHDRLALDVYYVRNLSFPLDVKVFLKTFVTVFKQDGVFVQEDDVVEAAGVATAN